MEKRLKVWKDEALTDAVVNRLLKENQEQKISPLLKVAAAVRIRRLKQLQHTLLQTPRDESNNEIIEAGNVAAHDPDIAADLALFTAGFLSKDEDLNSFRDMYGLRSDVSIPDIQEIVSHQTQLSKWCNITAKCITSFTSDYGNRANKNLSQILQLRHELLELYNKIGEPKEFEASPTVREKMSSLEKMVEKFERDNVARRRF